jgi:hypothetical protein
MAVTVLMAVAAVALTVTCLALAVRCMYLSDRLEVERALRDDIRSSRDRVGRQLESEKARAVALERLAGERVAELRKLVPDDSDAQ